MSGAPGRPGRPLVIGYGNTLRHDDGVGVRAAELMRVDPRFAGVDVVTVHQLTPELALDVGAASLVVFVDADVSVPPGEVVVHRLAGGSAAPTGAGSEAEPTPESAARPGGAGPAAGPGASSHHVGASELLELASALGAGMPDAFTVGIGVVDLELGEGLSPVVEAALPRCSPPSHPL